MLDSVRIAAIAVDSNDREALLSRARTLSWDRRFAESRAGFNALLEKDVADVDALLGVARTYAWSSRSRDARDAYESVLAADPGNVDARLGLAYLDLWAGEIGSAAAHAVELKQEQPDYEGVSELHDQVSRSAGAWWRVDLSQFDDTDDNRLRRYLVSGGFGLGHQIRLDLGVGRYDMSGPGGDASIDNIHATIGFHPARGQRLAATLGLDARTRTDNTTDSETLGGLAYSWGLDRRWQVHGSAMRNSIRYSPEITDNDITFDQIEARVNGAVGDKFSVQAAAGAADFSDDNERITAHAGFLYRLPLQKVRMQVGYTARMMDYDVNSASGYFAPQNFFAHLAQFRVSDEYGSRGNDYRLYVDAGVQSFTRGGIDVNNDAVLVLGGTLGFPLAKAAPAVIADRKSTAESPTLPHANSSWTR